MISAAIFSLMLASQEAIVPDPENPLSWGIAEWWHCHEPDTARKTCMSIAKYEKIDGNRYRNDAVTEAVGFPGVSMQTSMTVTVRNRSVCGRVLPPHIRSAVLMRDGVRVPPAESIAIIGVLMATTAPIFGKEICTFYRPDGARLRAEISINGVRMSELDQTVTWIQKDDTYRVRS